MDLMVLNDTYNRNLNFDMVAVYAKIVLVRWLRNSDKAVEIIYF